MKDEEPGVVNREREKLAKVKTGKSEARNQFVEGTYASLGSKRTEGMHSKLKERRREEKEGSQGGIASY